jgi:tagaturonate epimerase
MVNQIDLDQLLTLKDGTNLNENRLITLEIRGNYSIQVYLNSINSLPGGKLFIGRGNHKKYLFLLLGKNEIDNIWESFEGEEEPGLGQSGWRLKRCGLIHSNAEALKNRFDFTRPVLIGVTNSIGMGDRLGLANPGHIRALMGSQFKPILAQQSIRELVRTQRTPDEVMDAAVWSVFQEGYKFGYGSDADHLKTEEDIDLMIQAGFTMFTLDPSGYVDNDSDTYTEIELDVKLKTINWTGLKIQSCQLIDKYRNVKIEVSPELALLPTYVEIARAIVKYGNAIAHLMKLYEYIIYRYPGFAFEIEISVDETDSVTSPFEHFFVVNELKRLKMDFVSLAPRFIGDFEKGIDYKGNICLFEKEYLKHLAIVKYFGGYKISLHSGSDKFSVYRVIGSLDWGYTHIKTAGTSYLEGLRAIASCRPDLFREILNFARDLYENEKKSYHVSADPMKVKEASEYRDEELMGLFDQDEIRQVLHVTFGRVLTEKKSDGEFLFKNRILDCLNDHEELYYDLIEKHFRKHLDPFTKRNQEKYK